MSRLYEALQRARQDADAPKTKTVSAEPVAGSDGGSPRNVPPVPTEGRRGAVARPELTSAANGRTSAARPRVATATGVACPRCGNVSPAPSQVRWTARMFGFLGVPASRCTSCGHRFSSAEHQRGPTTTTRSANAVFPAFLRPADARTFQDVVRDLARDEEESTSGADRGAAVDDSRERATVVDMHSSTPSDPGRGTRGASGNE